jgi:phenylacetate-CoA ligase
MNNTFYYLLPYPLKVVATGAIALNKKQGKYGSNFQKHFDFLCFSDINEQIKQGKIELDLFLDKQAKVSRYYKIPKSRSLREMPVISKQIVLQNYDNLLQGSPFRIVKSSGTTGAPLPIPYCKDAYQKEYAFWWYHRSFGGVSRGEKVATFGGHRVADTKKNVPPFWAYNWAENQLFFSSYHLSVANLPYYIEKLNRFQPAFVHGYPSSLYLVAKFILDNNIELNFLPKMIATASETTLDFQRASIEEAFKTKLFIWYGNTEFCGHITECINGKLHIQPYHSHVRILHNDGTEAKPGEEGSIVATNFTNTTFPLINYDTKDIVRISKNQSCPCQRGGLIVDYISGRIEDYIITPEGRYVGRLDHLFKDARHVRNAQIVQSSINSINIRIEREPEYNQRVEQTIFQEAVNRLGDKMEILFEYVDEIPKNSNGKFSFIVQNLQTNLRLNTK